jgi:hypothetical protein
MGTSAPRYQRGGGGSAERRLAAMRFSLSGLKETLESRLRPRTTGPGTGGTEAAAIVPQLAAAEYLLAVSHPSH